MRAQGQKEMCQPVDLSWPMLLFFSFRGHVNSRPGCVLISLCIVKPSEVMLASDVCLFMLPSFCPPLFSFFFFLLLLLLLSSSSFFFFSFFFFFLFYFSVVAPQATLAANRSPLSVMWLSQPLYIPPATQCREFKQLQADMPYVVALFDICRFLNRWFFFSPSIYRQVPLGGRRWLQYCVQCHHTRVKPFLHSL